MVFRQSQHKFADGRASNVSFFHFNSALDAYSVPRRVSLTAEKCRAAGIIYIVPFGQCRLGAPVLKAKSQVKKALMSDFLDFFSRQSIVL